MENFMKIITIHAAAITTLTLTACGGSTSSGSEVVGVTLPASEAALQVFATGTGDLGDALAAGETLAARNVSSASILRIYDAKTSEPLNADVQIVQNADGELGLIVDGVRHNFTAAERKVEDDGKVYGYSADGSRTDGSFYNLFSENGEINEAIASGNGYASPFNYYFDSGDGKGKHGFVVVGTETAAAGLPTTGSAEFTGSSTINIFPAENFTSFSEVRQRVRGDVTMDVNFLDSTISGAISDLKLRVPGSDDDNPVAGVISMEETGMNANGYRGDLIMNAAGVAAFEIATSDIGKYSGAFYGPGAEETGGAIVTTTKTEDGTYNGVGFFVVTQD
jgi:hypothetical protein